LTNAMNLAHSTGESVAADNYLFCFLCNSVLLFLGHKIESEVGYHST